MDKEQLDTDLCDCLYPFGSQYQGRPLFDHFHRTSQPVSAAGIAAVADLLGRRAREVDGQGYEHAIVAGAVHPVNGWPAWVECRCRHQPGLVHVEVEFRLKAVVNRQPALDWPLECYNPFFGCHVRHLAWHGDHVILLYREKHRTYACSLAAGRPPVALPIQDEWLITDDLVTYRDPNGAGVRLLSLPDLMPLETLEAEGARARGLLPPRYDEAEAVRRRTEVWLADWHARDGQPNGD